MKHQLTPAERVYYDTLNLFGSDPQPPVLQEILDREHAAAEPAFKVYLERQAVLQGVKRHTFKTGLNAACGHFDTEVERDLFNLAAVTWNHLQALSKVTEALLAENVSLATKCRVNDI